MTKTERHTENEAKGNEHWLPCERCSNETKHVVRASIDVSDNIELYDVDVYQSFQIVECVGCRWLSFRHESTSSADHELEDGTGALRAAVREALYPARLPNHKPLVDDDFDLPSKVSGIYREAHFALRNNLPILAAIGIRALVEAVCAEKNATANDLQKRIDELVTLKVMTQDAADILHSTRLLGNAAAHEVLPPNQDKLLAAIQVAENLLQNVFILPGIARRLPKKT